jgi:hypothetical protein
MDWRIDQTSDHTVTPDWVRISLLPLWAPFLAIASISATLMLPPPLRWFERRRLRPESPYSRRVRRRGIAWQSWRTLRCWAFDCASAGHPVHQCKTG